MLLVLIAGCGRSESRAELGQVYEFEQRQLADAIELRDATINSIQFTTAAAVYRIIGLEPPSVFSSLDELESKYISFHLKRLTAAEQSDIADILSNARDAIATAKQAVSEQQRRVDEAKHRLDKMRD